MRPGHPQRPCARRGGASGGSLSGRVGLEEGSRSSHAGPRRWCGGAPRVVPERPRAPEAPENPKAVTGPQPRAQWLGELPSSRGHRLPLGTAKTLQPWPRAKPQEASCWSCILSKEHPGLGGVGGCAGGGGWGRRGLGECGRGTCGGGQEGSGAAVEEELERKPGWSEGGCEADFLKPPRWSWGPEGRSGGRQASGGRGGLSPKVCEDAALTGSPPAPSGCLSCATWMRRWPAST